jgi:hypothetical protein
VVSCPTAARVADYLSLLRKGRRTLPRREFKSLQGFEAAQEVERFNVRWPCEDQRASSGVGDVSPGDQRRRHAFVLVGGSNPSAWSR